MTKTWFTSDLHLGHSAVIGFCNRPYQSVEEMDADLCRQWNLVVEPGDTVYCLGDMCFHKPIVGVPMLRSLAGTKILIQGNHDKYSMAQYRAAGFSTILREAAIELQGKKIRLSHYPYWPEDPSKESENELRYEDRRPRRHGYEWLLCGHVHSAWQKLGKQINVGYDSWGYVPVSDGTIARLMQSESDDMTPAQHTGWREDENG